MFELAVLVEVDPSGPKAHPICRSNTVASLAVVTGTAGLWCRAAAVVNACMIIVTYLALLVLQGWD